MSIKVTLTAISQRLDALLAIPEGERTDFVRGSVSQLIWCKDEIERGIASMMPAPGILDDGENDQDDGDGLMSTTVSFIRPPQYSTKPCLPHRQHAYICHMPSRNLKQCKYCHDVQKMVHGDKISFGKRNKK